MWDFRIAHLQTKNSYTTARFRLRATSEAPERSQGEWRAQRATVKQRKSKWAANAKLRRGRDGECALGLCQASNAQDTTCDAAARAATPCWNGVAAANADQLTSADVS